MDKFLELLFFLRNLNRKEWKENKLRIKQEDAHVDIYKVGNPFQRSKQDAVSFLKNRQFPLLYH